MMISINDAMLNGYGFTKAISFFKKLYFCFFALFFLCILNRAFSCKEHLTVTLDHKPRFLKIATFEFHLNFDATYT